MVCRRGSHKARMVSDFRYAFISNWIPLIYCRTIFVLFSRACVCGHGCEHLMDKPWLARIYIYHVQREGELSKWVFGEMSFAYYLWLLPRTAVIFEWMEMCQSNLFFSKILRLQMQNQSLQNSRESHLFHLQFACQSQPLMSRLVQHRHFVDASDWLHCSKSTVVLVQLESKNDSFNRQYSFITRRCSSKRAVNQTPFHFGSYTFSMWFKHK